VTFGRWLPLATAVAPAGPGVLQVRAPALRDYPRGKSAMLYYDADDRDLAAALARARDACADAANDDEPANDEQELLVRFAAPEPARAPSESLRRLVDDFTRRFGARPLRCSFRR
jgi:hypothetical protein